MAENIKQGEIISLHVKIPYSMSSEAFSRVLIDKALEESEWNLLNPHQVRFELSSTTGRADYVLMDSKGLPLCVLESKNLEKDPYDAKEQASKYADKLKAPFIILSNGKEHWFWNYAQRDKRDAFRIERFPSPYDLERLKLKKSARKRPAELLGSSVVVSTLHSLFIDRRFRKEFTPFHFDLVISDEAHRSIYGDFREVVQFFQATRVGLTATPKAYLKHVDIEQLREESPKKLESRRLKDTYHYFDCKIGEPTYRYDIIDAVNDPEGPFLCLPKIYDIRSEITTKALEESGWTVTVDEREENFKIRDLERKIFTPERNQLICEQFLKHAQKDPLGTIGKSIIFAVNQRHATALTKILNEIQPDLAITITSRIDNASAIAKDFRDGKRKERVAVSVDMLSTGYNCKDLLNVVLARPIFSPAEYIQVKGRGTRLYTFYINNTKYDKKYFYILDFCGVAEYFEEKYDYTIPLKVPTQTKKSHTGSSDYGYRVAEKSAPYVVEKSLDIPIWEGEDTVVSTEIHMVGPDGEKVDVLTFRGSCEQDLSLLYKQDEIFKQAVDEEDDEAIEEILQEKFYNRPQMYYSPEKLVQAYGVPAPIPTFVYGVLKNKPIPTLEELVKDTIQNLSTRFNLRFNNERWIEAVTFLIANDKESRRRFIKGDMGIFMTSQFNNLGGMKALSTFQDREMVFEALKDTSLVRQAELGDFKEVKSG